MAHSHLTTHCMKHLFVDFNDDFVMEESTFVLQLEITFMLRPMIFQKHVNLCSINNYHWFINALKLIVKSSLNSTTLPRKWNVIKHNSLQPASTLCLISNYLEAFHLQYHLLYPNGLSLAICETKESFFSNSSFQIFQYKSNCFLSFFHVSNIFVTANLKFRIITIITITWWE